MRRERAPQIGPQQRRDHRAVAARRLALDAAVLPRRQRGELRIDERDDVVAEVGVVPADGGRVDELRAADRRERVDQHDHASGASRAISTEYESTNGATLNQESTMPLKPWIT
jgi:hypothetical protein